MYSRYPVIKFESNKYNEEDTQQTNETITLDDTEKETV